MASAEQSLVSALDPVGTPSSFYALVTTVPLSDSITLVTVSGQVATLSDGKVPETLAEQIEICLSKVKTCLAAAGGTVHDMTKLMYYFTEKGWEQEGVLRMLRERTEPWLEGHRPASTLLVVKQLGQPEFLCEFEAQAVVRRS